MATIDSIKQAISTGALDHQQGLMPSRVMTGYLVSNIEAKAYLHAWRTGHTRCGCGIDTLSRTWNGLSDMVGEPFEAAWEGSGLEK